MPFGSFMDAVSHPVFLIIHAALALMGLFLWRRAGARAFLLYVVAEGVYITYHLDITAFHFAHTLAEVCDGLAFLSLGMAVGARPG
jgi:hypothetical protein